MEFIWRDGIIFKKPGVGQWGVISRKAGRRGHSHQGEGSFQFYRSLGLKQQSWRSWLGGGHTANATLEQLEWGPVMETLSYKCLTNFI